MHRTAMGKYHAHIVQVVNNWTICPIYWTKRTQNCTTMIRNISRWMLLSRTIRVLSHQCIIKCKCHLNERMNSKEFSLPMFICHSNISTKVQIPGRFLDTMHEVSTILFIVPNELLIGKILAMIVCLLVAWYMWA